MLHTETVLPETLDLLKSLQAFPALSQMRLVGGTALALQLGHRTSIDLDLFGSFDPSVSFRKVLADSGHEVEGSDFGEVQTLSVDHVKVDLVNYPYGWVSPPVAADGLTLAGLDDIMAMKISAAANRGKKKDFLDIATLLEHHSLSEMFSVYRKKFAVSEISFALRGLTYFDEAEEDPMPKMLSPLTWPEAKNRIVKCVQSFVQFV